MNKSMEIGATINAHKNSHTIIIAILALVAITIIVIVLIVIVVVVERKKPVTTPPTSPSAAAVPKNKVSFIKIGGTLQLDPTRGMDGIPYYLKEKIELPNNRSTTVCLQTTADGKSYALINSLNEAKFTKFVIVNPIDELQLYSYNRTANTTSLEATYTGLFSRGEVSPLLENSLKLAHDGKGFYLQATIVEPTNRPKAMPKYYFQKSINTILNGEVEVHNLKSESIFEFNKVI